MIRKALAVLGLVALSAAPLGASAAGLMNVTTQSQTQISNGTYQLNQQSWDSYRGAQINIVEHSDSASSNVKSLGLSGFNFNSDEGVWGTDPKLTYTHNMSASQNFSLTASVEFFKGADASQSTLSANYASQSSSIASGVQTNF